MRAPDYGRSVSSSIARSATRGPLDDIARRAGAVFPDRGTTRVALHYGSAAAELAVCIRAVGLAHRADLAQLWAHAPAEELENVTARLLSGSIAPGGARYAGGAWWCRADERRLVMLCAATDARRRAEWLRAQARGDIDLTVEDRSTDSVAIGVIGRGAPGVLAAVGAYGPTGDPRRTVPFAHGTVDGFDVTWLLESQHRALALTTNAAACAVWRALERTGRKFGISCVGDDAIRRYALLEHGRMSA